MSRDSGSTCGDEKVCKLGLIYGSQSHVVIVACGYSMSGHGHTLLRTHENSIASYFPN